MAEREAARRDDFQEFLHHFTIVRHVSSFSWHISAISCVYRKASAGLEKKACRAGEPMWSPQSDAESAEFQ